MTMLGKPNRNIQSDWGVVPPYLVETIIPSMLIRRSSEPPGPNVNSKVVTPTGSTSSRERNFNSRGCARNG
jgi:hypothetical protein